MMYITCQRLWYKAMTVLVSCHWSLFYFCSLKWFYIYINAYLFGGHTGMLFGLRKSLSMKTKMQEQDTCMHDVGESW